MNKINIHSKDPVLFREAIDYTAAETGFNPRLVEKDYFASFILEYITSHSSELTFKGGTCLSKVYVEFYRLSEDLDFSISISPDASRTARSKKIAPAKKHINKIAEKLKDIEIETELTGHNESTQYIAVLSYKSVLSSRSQKIKVEIGLREELLLEPERREAKALLLDPIKEKRLNSPIKIEALSFIELTAEKLRAALTRREPAIRDYFDIDYIVEAGKLKLENREVIELLNKKLSVPGTGNIGISKDKFKELERQLATELKPVLRRTDFNRFDLKRAFETISQIKAKL